MKKPNILLIMADQMRADSMSCSGHPLCKTPALDALAAGGTRFSNAFSPNPICVPARACLTTGFYPSRCTGSKGNNGAIREEMPKLGCELSARGYSTYAMGKLHYPPYREKPDRVTHGIETVELAESGRMLGEVGRKYPDTPQNLYGIEDYFDYLADNGYAGYTRGNGMGNNDVYAAASFIPEELYVDKWVTDRALHHMQNHIDNKSDKPFFMWASFPKPHSAYDPPEPWNRMYDPREVPMPCGDVEILKARGLTDLANRHYNYMWDKMSPEAVRCSRAHYYGLISFQDAQISRLISFLEQNGIERDTIVIYTADHGDMLGDFGIFFKTNMYDGSVAIPLLFRYPRAFPAGVVCPQPAGLQDILPTLLKLVDETDLSCDGVDLSPALSGGRTGRDIYVSQCHNKPAQLYMASDGDYKYIYTQQGGIEELYDRTEDKMELDNKIADAAYKKHADRLREHLYNWILNNENSGIAENGRFNASERPEAAYVTQRVPYGRRWY